MLYIALGAAIGVFVMATLGLAAAVRIYLGAPERRAHHVSAENRQPPPIVRQMLGELTVLGFRRLGETELVLPDNTFVGLLLMRQRPQTAWLMVDSAATTLAAVVPIGPLVSLESWLVDDSVVMTTTPAGEDIDDDDLRTSGVKGSLAEAYTHHRLVVDGRAQTHGLPVGIHSMGDHLRQDAVFRQRFARRFLRGAIVRRQLIPLATVIVATVVLTAWLLGEIVPQ